MSTFLSTSSLRRGAAALGLSLLIGFSLAGTAEAYQCKNGYKQVETLAKLKAKSKATGRALWTSEVKNEYGLQWSAWDIAANKSQSCEWTGNRWYCITKAKPCLYVAP